jgi:predicted ATPase with chaperone activity
VNAFSRTLDLTGTLEERDQAVTAPPAPTSIQDTGLSEEAIVELLLKVLYVQGARLGEAIATTVRLPFPLIDDLLMTLQQRMMVEVKGTHGHGRSGYTFDLTTEGRQRAREALAVSSYVGPAPVPLKMCSEWIQRQSVRSYRVPPERIRGGFSDLVLSKEVLEALGPAVNHGRSLFLYGHPGNGKTAIAERIARLMGGSLYMPHAVDIDGETMILFDPVHHRLVEDDEESDDPTDVLLREVEHDQRFVHIHRPTVFVGGDLTMEQLDLQYEPVAKLYQAPFQLKASGGVLIIDDFGRQLVGPTELLNRWIVPLEKEVDFLSLHTGIKFPVPFDTLLVFATNLDPTDLVDEAFLRRINYKVQVGSPGRAEWEQIFRDVCADRGIEFDAAALDATYKKYYERFGIWPRGCHPRDIMDHLEAIAQYEGFEPRMTEEALDRSCRSYFLVMNPDALESRNQTNTGMVKATGQF